MIANRGEIAVRIIRACKDHGLKALLYSDEDRNLLHAQMADEAYLTQQPDRCANIFEY